MKEIFFVLKDKKCLKRMVISGILFWALAAPFRALFNLIPGVTEVRPANMLPVVLGLVWGPAGAWGIAIANACSDIFVSHSPAVVWIPGFFINFFFSYLPYKLWYSLGCGKGECQPPKLGNVSQIIKYIYVCFLDSLVVTTFLGMLFEFLGFQEFSSSAFLLFFNNFDFAIVLGVPLILLMTNFKNIDTWIPMELYQGESTKKREKGNETGEEGIRTVFSGSINRFDSMLFLISAVGIGYYLAGSRGMAQLSHQTAGWILAAIAICLVVYLFKPMDKLKEKDNYYYLPGISIRAKVIIGFLILAVAFVLVIGTATYISLNTEEFSFREIWQYIYVVVGISLNIVFVISLVFLKYVEKNITLPLEQLSDFVQRFSGRNHRETEENHHFLEGFSPVKTGDEIEKLSDSFHQMMWDITDYVENLETMTREKERIGAELNVATQIQADMLPRIFPAFPERKEFDIYASMKPAKEVGGDFYDFFLVDANHLAIVIADVSGKGVPAALFMVIAKTLIKNYAQLGASPADIFTLVNNQLCEGNEAGLFVTAWLGILDINTGEFTFVNAGHNPPLFMHEDQDFEYLKVRPGFVLAGMEGMQYAETTIHLSVGDRLYLYTDGVTEAENSREELYGDDRLKQAINQSKHGSAREMAEAIQESVRDFVADAEQFDDITMVSFVYNGGNAK